MGGMTLQYNPRLKPLLPLSTRNKRHLDPVKIVRNALSHLVFGCDDDSYEDAKDILETCLFMQEKWFQAVLYSFPIRAPQRHEVERKYMRARIKWQEER